MKTISLWQPWGSWVIHKHKPTETRLHNRFTGLKGLRIAIHATAKTSKAGERIDEARAAAVDFWDGVHDEAWDLDNLPFGAVLGTGFVEDARLLTGADSKDALIDCANVQRYGLVLSDVFKFEEPIPARGAMGIWEWTPPEGLKTHG